MYLGSSCLGISSGDSELSLLVDVFADISLLP